MTTDPEHRREERSEGCGCLTAALLGSLFWAGVIAWAGWRWWH